MSQGVIPLSAGGGGAAVRGKINDALQRLQTKGSGTARPSDIAIGEDWIETDNPGAGTWSWWLYDGTSDILLGTINSTTHAVTWSNSIAASLLTTQGDLLYRDGSGPARLAAGADAYKALFTGGSGANPSWAGTWKVLGEATPSGASSVAFTGIPAAVHHLLLEWELIPGTNNVGIDLQTYGADGNVDTTSGDYNYLLFAMNSAGASGIGFGSPGVISLHSTTGISNNSSWSSKGFLVLPNIQAARYTAVHYQSSCLGNDGNVWDFRGVGHRIEADRITGLRFIPSAGTLTGRATLLGMSN